MRWMTRARDERASVRAGAASDAPETDDPIALEIQAHIDAVAAELQESGLSPADARAQALRRFGDVVGVHARCERESPQWRARRRRFWAVAGLNMALAGTVGLLGAELIEAQTKIDALGELMPDAVVRGYRLAAGSRATMSAEVAGWVARPGTYGVGAPHRTMVSELSWKAGVNAVDGVRGTELRLIPGYAAHERAVDWSNRGLRLQKASDGTPTLVIPLLADGRPTVDVPVVPGDRIVVGWPAVATHAGDDAEHVAMRETPDAAVPGTEDAPSTTPQR